MLLEFRSHFFWLKQLHAHNMHGCHCVTYGVCHKIQVVENFARPKYE